MGYDDNIDQNNHNIDDTTLQNHYDCNNGDDNVENNEDCNNHDNHGNDKDNTDETNDDTHNDDSSDYDEKDYTNSGDNHEESINVHEKSTHRLYRYKLVSQSNCSQY